jgi:putative heme-binding domain-containing protein
MSIKTHWEAGKPRCFDTLAWLVFAVLTAACSAPAAELAGLPQVPEGFEAEVLRVAREGEGSWISMTFDDRGRLIFGRDDAGLMRLTLADEPSGIAVERLDTGDAVLKHCRGGLYAHGALYVTATDTPALYRLKDTDGDDRFDEFKFLKQLDYRSRYGHGANQIVLGPDGMIYFVVGNDVSFPEGTSPESPYRAPRNDWLLPNPHDAGHDNRVGYIVRTDPEGNSWEVLAGGFRNQVDMAFNSDGEMFTYDADMEWDVGLPWYRPTRVNHVVSAGEYGWRWGTGKWPVHYQDSLPTTLDTGLGSPTGIVFGYRGRLPAKYKRGLFLGDWQNGRILLATLKPAGASYSSEYEVFAQGAPLNVCDMTFGPDGALYFITGGRGSQSALYRVRYTGDEPLAADDGGNELVDRAAAEARALRRRLEQFHTKRDVRAIEEAWPHLNSSDRWLRFAARMAVERQDLNSWRQRALKEDRPLAAATALMALARVASPADQPQSLAALNTLPLENLDREALLTALRAYELSFNRQGRPSEEHCRSVEARLSPLYPHSVSVVNLELCELLVYLNSPGVVGRTVDLVEAAASQEEQIHYAQALLHAQSGWTLDDRRTMLAWLQEARSFRGGKLLSTVINQMRTDFVNSLSEEERGRLAAEIAALETPAADVPSAPPRPLVRQWTMADFAADLEQPLAGRSAENARTALAAASCLKCHRMGDEGGAVGPDLTHVGRRYDERALLESILNPSKEIDPKYRDTAYILDDGKVVIGRPVQVDAARIVVETDPLTQATVTILRASIDETQPANVSPMPTGLADVLTREEVLDLLAYLKSGGDPDNAAFQAAGP